MKTKAGKVRCNFSMAIEGIASFLLITIGRNWHDKHFDAIEK